MFQKFPIDQNILNLRMITENYKHLEFVMISRVRLKRKGERYGIRNKREMEQTER